MSKLQLLAEEEFRTEQLDMLGKGGGEMKSLHRWRWSRPHERHWQPFLHDAQLGRPSCYMLGSGDPREVFTKKLLDFFFFSVPLTDEL